MVDEAPLVDAMNPQSPVVTPGLEPMRSPLFHGRSNLKVTTEAMPIRKLTTDNSARTPTQRNMAKSFSVVRCRSCPRSSSDSRLHHHVWQGPARPDHMFACPVSKCVGKDGSVCVHWRGEPLESESKEKYCAFGWEDLARETCLAHEYVMAECRKWYLIGRFSAYYIFMYLYIGCLNDSARPLNSLFVSMNLSVHIALSL